MDDGSHFFSKLHAFGMSWIMFCDIILTAGISLLFIYKLQQIIKSCTDIDDYKDNDIIQRNVYKWLNIITKQFILTKPRPKVIQQSIALPFYVLRKLFQRIFQYFCQKY